MIHHSKHRNGGFYRPSKTIVANTRWNFIVIHHSKHRNGGFYRPSKTIVANTRWNFIVFVKNTKLKIKNMHLVFQYKK